MIGRRTRPPLGRDESGLSAVEFALLAPLFIGMILGFLELADWSYMKAGTTGALEKVARSSGVGGPVVDTTAFEAPVETMIKGISSKATFVWTKKSYYQFSGVGQPEKLTSDKNGNGKYDPGDCWEDSNPNGVYDSAQGTAGVGGADDIVYYTVTVSFPPMIALSGFFSGIPDTRSVTATTMIKRQPFAAQAVPSIVCK